MTIFMGLNYLNNLTYSALAQIVHIAYFGLRKSLAMKVIYLVVPMGNNVMVF